MILPTARPAVAGPMRIMTAADLALLPTDLPSGPSSYELDNGILVMMVPPGNVHGAVQLNFGSQLKVQGEACGHGKARTEVGIVLWRGPDRVVGADVAFIAARLLPIRESAEGYLETILSLVVEVQSRNDTAAYLQRKVADYLAAGVECVWVADPAQTVVTEHRNGMSPKVYRSGDILTLEGMIPGFQFPVAAAFEV